MCTAIFFTSCRLAKQRRSQSFRNVCTVCKFVSVFFLTYTWYDIIAVQYPYCSFRGGDTHFYFFIYGAYFEVHDKWENECVVFFIPRHGYSRQTIRIYLVLCMCVDTSSYAWIYCMYVYVYPRWLRHVTREAPASSCCAVPKAGGGICSGERLAWTLTPKGRCVWGCVTDDVLVAACDCPC